MPGKFALAYLPRNKVVIEFVTVTPEGIRYRKNLFRSLNQLMKWFKEHFKEPIPQSVLTPAHSVSAITPSINQIAIQKASASIPSHMFNTISQVTKTPQQVTSSSMRPPSSYHGNPRSSQQPTPSFNTPSQQKNRPNNDWRKTPRDSRTPLYQTPGASSMMSISSPEL